MRLEDSKDLAWLEGSHLTLGDGPSESVARVFYEKHRSQQPVEPFGWCRVEQSGDLIGARNLLFAHIKQPWIVR